MSKKKPKSYVVWKGKVPGVYSTWEECKNQVEGFEGAVYKSFLSLEEANSAFLDSPFDHVKKNNSSVHERKKKSDIINNPVNPPSNRHDTVLPLPNEVTSDAWAVDAACSGNPGKMEYRGVCLQTGAVLFHFGPIWGTNNVGEFLAIVHALALADQQKIKKTLYSDSRNAMLWVKKKKCNTRLVRNAKSEPLFQYIDRAETWLKTHRVTLPILKWETRRWGEIPADFGRK